MKCILEGQLPTAEQINVYTKVQIDSNLSNKADNQLSNLNTSQLALVNLGAGVRPNLLDNAYFIGGGSQLGYGIFPINQPGLTSYGPGTSLDRWICDGNVSINKENVSFSSSFYQNVSWDKMKELLGKTVTLSVFFDENNTESGTITLANSYQNSQIVPTSDPNLQLYVNPDGVCQIFRYAGGAEPKAVKLEEGANQTLFIPNNDGTFTLLQQSDMDYAIQLQKCRQYQRVYGPGIQGIWYDDTSLYIAIPFDSPMRAAPALSILKTNLTVSTLGVNDQKAENATLGGNIYTNKQGIAFAHILGFTGGTAGKVVSFQDENWLLVNANV